jgi:hypothetical protein
MHPDQMLVNDHLDGNLDNLDRVINEYKELIEYNKANLVKYKEQLNTHQNPMVKLNLNKNISQVEESLREDTQIWMRLMCLHSILNRSI